MIMKELIDNINLSDKIKWIDFSELLGDTSKNLRNKNIKLLEKNITQCIFYLLYIAKENQFLRFALY